MLRHVTLVFLVIFAHFQRSSLCPFHLRPEHSSAILL